MQPGDSYLIQVIVEKMAFLMQNQGGFSRVLNVILLKMHADDL